MDIFKQARVIPTSQQRGGFPITFLLGVLAVLFGVAFLLKLTGTFRLPIPIDDKILQYATSIFSIMGGLYMIYKAFWRPRIYI